MRLFARLAAVVLGLAGTGLMVLPPAWAAPGTGVDDVVKALGLTSEPADYVILVDTSGSMNAEGRYTKVRRELGRLVDGLDSDDRVSLFTFDSSVERRFRGAVGADGSDVLAGLPGTASGQHTDIGAAIEAGLTELERSDIHRLAALILITDGKLDAPGSRYETVRSDAWKQLRSRASALAQDHQVAAYAVSLQATTDAGLLTRVFPRASEVAAAQVGERFARVGADMLRLQAADALKEEVAQPISVTWSGDLAGALAGDRPAAVQLDFASPYVHVPVHLSDLRVQAPAGLEVELTGLPDELVLEPRSRVEVEVEARVRGSAGTGATVSLTATVDSPWRQAIEDDLGLEFSPALSGSALVPGVPPAPVTLPPMVLPVAGVAGLLVVVVLLVMVLARMLLTPAVSGVLSFQRDGRHLGEFVVTGRRMKFGAPIGATELSGLAGSVRGARGGRGAGPAVRVDAHFGDARARGLLADGASLPLGDVEITFVSGRRRILDKIGVPLQAESASIS